MMKRTSWLSVFALSGASLIVVSLGAAPAIAQPAAGGSGASQNGASDWSPKNTVNPSYGEAVGAPCTGGSGVTVCPTLKTAGDPNTVKDVFGTVRDKELKVSFCVSTQGVPEDAEIVQSSGKARVDREMLKFIRTYRYNPGTVDGAPARLCGVVAAFRL